MNKLFFILFFALCLPFVSADLLSSTTIIAKTASASPVLSADEPIDTGSHDHSSGSSAPIMCGNKTLSVNEYCINGTIYKAGSRETPAANISVAAEDVPKEDAVIITATTQNEKNDTELPKESHIKDYIIISIMILALVTISIFCYLKRKKKENEKYLEEGIKNL